MKYLTLGAIAAAPFLFAASAFAADLGSEINNAQTHAGLAAAATSINTVHMHMHHALNCLVGPNGDGFDSKQMNPCAQSGNGAIPDETDQIKKARLITAKNQLETGIAATNLQAAQSAASSAQATIVGVR
ncbi:MAG: hypothetical protein ACREFW_04035 [Rhizomicrobium sp.]